MRWARVMLAVSLLVGWTSAAAAAECAWVLWLRKNATADIGAIGVTEMRSWYIKETYEQLKECRLRREKELNREEERLRKEQNTKWVGRPESHLVRHVTETGLITELHFYCLPGTLDPRSHEFGPTFKFPERE